MNNNIKNTLRTGVVAALGLMTMYACTDTWNDHYDSGTTVVGNAYDGTTMQALDQEASEFAQIVRATGFDAYLNSPSSYTVWAPANGTFNKDSLLSLLGTNKDVVVRQFVKNHIARYSLPMNLEPQQINLLNSKVYTMSAKNEHKIGNVNIIEPKSNIKCNNGILHMIGGMLPFNYNLFELIESEYNKSTNPNKEKCSLYAYLKTADKDSLIESQSVYRGYDEFGNKVWVDSVTLRNNTILRDLDALIYEEDSSYIALVPSIEAYQERYNLVQSYLNFNPSMDNGLDYSRVDSLKNSYGHRFSMSDLFYNRNLNEHWKDSLKSTQYTSYSWPDHLYYRTSPRFLPEDKEVNDILQKVNIQDSIPCSNGITCLFDEYPMSIYDQFFRKINMNSLYMRFYYIDKETKIKGSNVQVTKNVSDPESQNGTWTVNIYSYPEIYDDDGNIIGYDYDNPIIVDSKTQSYSYFYVPAASTTNPNIGFYIPNNFSGEYDIYLVTMPSWFYVKDFDTNKLRYRFRASIWEKDEKGNFPATGNALTVDGNNTFETPEPQDPNVIRDTTYIGSYTFKYAYYGESEPGVILQINPNVLSSQRKNFSNSMIFSSIILKPRKDGDSAPESSVKARTINLSSENAVKKTPSNVFYKFIKQ